MDGKRILDHGVAVVEDSALLCDMPAPAEPQAEDDGLSPEL